MILHPLAIKEMQQVAYEQPLTQARGAAEAYFRAFYDLSISVGLTVNK